MANNVTSAGYTTLRDLSELGYGTLTGKEYVLASNDETSYKMTVETMLTWAVDNTDTLSSALTNKIMDDVSNLVHANAIHFSAVPEVTMTEGTLVKLVSNESNTVHVGIAEAGDKVIGICENIAPAGVLTTFVVRGVLRNYNATAYIENSSIYWQNGSLTSTPDLTQESQYIGKVLDNTSNGRVLINLESEDTIARNIQFINTGSTLASTDVQSAVTEVSNREIHTVRLLINADHIVLPFPAFGDIIGNMASVEDDVNNVNVRNDYTCNIDPADSTLVLFDTNDNLNGFWATVSYYK